MKEIETTYEYWECVLSLHSLERERDELRKKYEAHEQSANELIEVIEAYDARQKVLDE